MSTDCRAIKQRGDAAPVLAPGDSAALDPAISNPREPSMNVHDPQLKSLVPETDVSRRVFVVTSLAGGFALAVQPVSAQTITTDASGLTAGEVKVPVAGGEI